MCFPDLMSLKGFIKGIAKGKLLKVQGVSLFYSVLKSRFVLLQFIAIFQTTND